MRVLFVHPGPLMYTEVFLRLEPLGLEIVAAAARRAGHEVRLCDLQRLRPEAYFQELSDWRPGALGFSLNYMANIPEVVDLAVETRRRLPEAFVFVGGHSASFMADEILRHARGAIDCVVRGEGEAVTPRLLEAVEAGRRVEELPGVVTLEGRGPAPALVERLGEIPPARDLVSGRDRYFIGTLDPCASAELSRGCPWDCAFCSAWTFYARSYRRVPPELAAADLARIREPNVFIVDDVAFIHPEDGFAIGRELEKRRVRKQYYLETRGDVLLRNQEVFRYWRKLGLEYLFLGLEAIDEEGLKVHRKRVTLSRSLEALEVARSLGIYVAVNIISDPGWDERQFEAVREWALAVPEIVHLTVNTPYPGTETWRTEPRELATRDYRLFDMQHAVLPTALPLDRFYGELVRTQQVLNRKHLGFVALRDTFVTAARLLARGQTGFLKMLWKFNQVYNPQRQIADHARAARYELQHPRGAAACREDGDGLFVHRPGPGRFAMDP